MIKTLSMAALIAATASASVAGSLENAPTTYVQEEPDTFVPAPAGSGIGAPLIIGGILAALAIAAVVANNDDDEPVRAD